MFKSLQRFGRANKITKSHSERMRCITALHDNQNSWIDTYELSLCSSLPIRVLEDVLTSRCDERLTAMVLMVLS
jgi:hypothetical protein